MLLESVCACVCVRVCVRLSAGECKQKPHSLLKHTTKRHTRRRRKSAQETPLYIPNCKYFPIKQQSVLPVCRESETVIPLPGRRPWKRIECEWSEHLGVLRRFRAAKKIKRKCIQQKIHECHSKCFHILLWHSAAPIWWSSGSGICRWSCCVRVHVAIAIA